MNGSIHENAVGIVRCCGGCDGLSEKVPFDPLRAVCVDCFVDSYRAWWFRRIFRWTLAWRRWMVDLPAKKWAFIVLASLSFEKALKI
jgi:hypothetical protein